MTVGFGIMEFISDLNENNYQKIIWAETQTEYTGEWMWVVTK